ncbi:MAG: hypothetical protein P4L43_17585 [Syntrophobacteraceae bacterium]|nr:hypothetical protein [Syntrophobacteraceae bacterium]
MTTLEDTTHAGEKERIPSDEGAAGLGASFMKVGAPVAIDRGKKTKMAMSYRGK